MPGDGPHVWYGCRTIRWGMMHHLPRCNAQAVQSGHFAAPPHTPPTLWHGPMAATCVATQLPHAWPLTWTRPQQVWDASPHPQDPLNHGELTPTAVHHPGAHGW